MMDSWNTQFSVSTNVSDEPKSLMVRENIVCGRPIMSETRNLFKSFMLSNDDVVYINNLYEQIEDKTVNTIPLPKFIDYFQIDINDEFTRNFVDYLRSENGNINYYVFIKLVLYVTLLSTSLLLRNIGGFFQKSSKEMEQTPLNLFLALFGTNVLPQSLVAILDTYYKTNHDLLLSLEMIKYNADFHFITDKMKSLFNHFTCSLPNYKRTAIIMRVQNRTQHITYFESNFKYIPLTFCQKIDRFIHGYENPNVFHHFFKLKSLNTYRFPYLFEQCHCSVRAGSQASSLRDSPFRNTSKKVPKSYYRSSLLNAHRDSLYEVEIYNTTHEQSFLIDKIKLPNNKQNEIHVKVDNINNINTNDTNIQSDNKLFVNIKCNIIKGEGPKKFDVIKGGDTTEENSKDINFIKPHSGSIRVRSHKSCITGRKFMKNQSSQMLFS